MGLKYSEGHVVNRFFYDSGFIAPFIEHLQTRLGIILRGPRTFRMVNEHWLHVSGCINSLMRVSLSFEV